jgi:hypothetical protein
MPFFKFICTECGHSDEPCVHFAKNKIERMFGVIESGILEIIHLLNRPQSATLTLKGEHGMATIEVGKTATSQFQEWTGPSGSGEVVPNAGTINYTSDNQAVATVDANGVATGVAPGTCNISGTDSVNNLTASDSLTVTAPAAQSATLTLTAV